MTVEHVLAVVPVADLARARDWYVRLFGRAPDNQPMETLDEWRVTGTGWVQVHVDPDRAGRGLLNLAVDDVDAHVRDLRERGVAAGEVQVVTKGVQLCPLQDPDGNVVTLLGGFRTTY